MSPHGETPREPDPELDDVSRMLDDAAAHERELMREAEELEHAPGLEKVERILESTWGDSAPQRRGRHWIGMLALVGVAAAIVAMFWLRGDHAPGGDRPHDQFLDANDRGIVHPLAQAERWDYIEWLGPADGTYKIEVFSDQGDPIYSPVDSIRGTVHHLSPEVTARWPAKITIEISMRQKDGTWTRIVSADRERAP